MAIVTLITDWGNSDYYVGAMKGILLTQIPNLHVVDISHEIIPFDLGHARWVLGNCWYLFPEGTVHVTGVKGQSNSDSYTVAAKFMNHYFIGCNDGFLDLLFGKKPDEIYYVLSSDGKKVRHDYEVLASAAGFIAGGGKLKDMGKPVDDYILRTMINPIVDENMISGHVIFIDRFGNAIINITKELFDEASKGRQIEIYLKSREYSINTISENYDEVGPAAMLAIFNAAGYLEIALRAANASQLLGLSYNDMVRIEFK